MTDRPPQDQIFHLCWKCGVGFVTAYGLPCWTCRMKDHKPEPEKKTDWLSVTVTTLCLLAVMLGAVAMWKPGWIN